MRAVCVLQARSEYLILLLLLPQSDLSADAAANLVLAGGMQRQRQRETGGEGCNKTPDSIHHQIPSDHLVSLRSVTPFYQCSSSLCAFLCVTRVCGCKPAV